MIDDTDKKILRILQEKARIPNVEVSRQVGMAPSAVLERIRKLEKNGIIDGYEVRLNPERLMRSLAAFLFVEADLGKSDIASIGKALAEIPETQEVHFASGADCFIVKTRTADAKGLERLIEERFFAVKGVRSVRTNIVMSSHKETLRIPLDSLEDGQ